MSESLVRPGQVGKSVNRVEGPDKVTGRAQYTSDVDVPGVTYAVLVQSEVPSGEVIAESVRTSAARAEKAPGVLHVLTPLNCPTVYPPPADMSDDLPLERRPPLSDLTVQHVGQHMAMVVADSPENAGYAASLFDLRYRRHPAQLSPHERHDTYWPDHFVKLEEEKLQDRRGIDHEPTGVRVTARYRTPTNAHYPIELSSTIASWDGDVLTVHDTTRWITGERRALAAYLGIAESNIRLLAPLVGGAFGSKSFLWMHVVLCAVAARTVGRPVKLVLTRNQMFSSTGHRPTTTQDVTLIADEAGLIASTEHHTLTETSTVAHFCEPAGLSTRFLYHSPRLHVSHEVARINAPTPCFMRGPGEAPGLFALEVAMDELAEAVGIDPLELRIRNHIDYDQATGKPWSGNRLLDCYRIGGERFGWSTRPLAPRSLRRDDVMVGWGVATATYPGRRMAAGCRVTTDKDGRVRFASATHEVGNGVRTVMTQVGADAAGLALAQVAFDSGDSSFPDAPYSGASQTTATVGSAVWQAGGEWKRRLIALACSTDHSPLHGAQPAAVDVVDGELRATNLSERISVGELLHDAPQTWFDTLNFDVTSDATADDRSAIQSFGAHFCEVEIDEQIGRAAVTRWVAVLDCGRVVNPKLARNQVMGGITFGLGMALLEQVPYDLTTAQLIGEYYVPTHADRPHFDISFVDTPDYALDPVGVRGIGEIGTCGVAAAISNAVHHATGKRLRDLPITLEDLMAPYECGR
jgi:xanthine dehydrogenase YagR molybdenum-binding subunit